LSDEALNDGGDVYCALYEFEDPEAIAHLAKLKGRAHAILSNMPGTNADKQKTDDTYAPERKEIHVSGAEVIDRVMPSGHIGHNRFQVLDKGGPQALLFGSTTGLRMRYARRQTIPLSRARQDWRWPIKNRPCDRGPDQKCSPRERPRFPHSRSPAPLRALGAIPNLLLDQPPRGCRGSAWRGSQAPP